MSLKQIKANYDLTGSFTKLYEAILVVCKSDMLSNGVRAIVILFLAIAYKVFSSKLEEYNKKQATKLSIEEQEDLKKYLDELNKKSDDTKVTDLEDGF